MYIDFINPMIDDKIGLLESQGWMENITRNPFMLKVGKDGATIGAPLPLN